MSVASENAAVPTIPERPDFAALNAAVTVPKPAGANAAPRYQWKEFEGLSLEDNVAANLWLEAAWVSANVYAQAAKEAAAAAASTADAAAADADAAREAADAVATSLRPLQKPPPRQPTLERGLLPHRTARLPSRTLLRTSPFRTPERSP